MIGIKAITKRPWQGPTHIYRTWYEPFDNQSDIDKSLWYALGQGITTAPMASDVSLWPMLLDAAERYRPMDADEQAAALAEVRRYQSIFPTA